MRIAIGADWVAFEHKQALIEHVASLGHQVLDMGGDSSEANDYPDFAAKVGRAVAGGEADLGILMCGTGIGMSIAANKVRGIRAALCHDAFTVVRSRNHNDANVLAMGAWVVSIPHAKELVELFLAAPYDAGRHVPRLEKISALEAAGGEGLP
jgi:RpiB/LacA/LacB family sugar-phosphate isomerase